MAITTITLLISNLVVVGAASIYLGKEINRAKKETQDSEARTFMHMCKFTNSIKEDIKSLEGKVNKEEIKKDIKNHISKEFLAMAFRDVRIVSLNRKGVK